MKQLLATLAQSDTEYTASIAIDGRSDSHAMKVLSVLGIIYLPATCVATLLSMDVFFWRDPDGKFKVSPSLWVFGLIAIMLTCATFGVWIVWSRIEEKKSKEQLTISHTKPRFRPDSISRTSTVIDLSPTLRNSSVLA